MEQNLDVLSDHTEYFIGDYVSVLSHVACSELAIVFYIL